MSEIKWTKEKVFEESKKYSSLSEFVKKNVGQHILLLENTVV